MVPKLIRKTFLLFLFLGTCAMLANAQTTVKGNIKDENGAPLPGVTVVEKGTNNGNVTDLDGNFELTVPENATLVISYVGYNTEEIPVQGKSQIELAMVPDIVALGDVVVIGYGTVKKSDLTGAVASVKAESIKDIPVARVDEALQGKAAGVMVLQNSGQPGSSPIIRVRGLATINGGNPLVVIDGIGGGSLASLNPNDIESIEVLKDAASQSIYGSAGGNGVILVTTKKGKSGKIQTNLDMYWGMQKPWNTVEVANSQEFAEIYNQSMVNQGLDPFFPYYNGQYWNAVDSTKPLANTDWQDEIFRTATMQNYNLSVSGGNEKSNYFFSVGYNSQEGTMLKTYSDKFVIRLNSSFQLSNRIEVGENFNIARTISSGQAERNEYNSPASLAVQMLPFVPVFAEDGSGNYAFMASGMACNVANPMAQIAHDKNKTTDHSLFGNVFARIKLIKGLTFESRFGAHYNPRHTTRFTPTFTIGDVANTSSTQSNTVSQYDERVDFSFSWQWQNFFNYSFTLGNRNNFTLMAGMESGEYVYSYIRGVTNHLFNNTDAMQNFMTPTEETVLQLYGMPTETSGYSYFGRLNYDYAGLILLQANVRRDASSKFGPNNRVGVFPAASVAFKFSELDFIKNLGWITFGKVRVGYGETGNSDIQPFLYINTIGALPVNGYPFSNETQTGAGLLTAANPDLKWETVITENIGLDLGLLKNRLNISLDLFARKNKDMLLPKSVPLTVGYMVTAPDQELGNSQLETRPTVNYGKLNNKGFEISIEFKDKIGDLNYSISGNFTRATTIVTDIDDPIMAGQGRGFSQVCRTQNDEPVSAFYGFKTNGIYQESDFTWYKDKAGKWARVAIDPNGTNIVSGTDLAGNPVDYTTLSTVSKPGNRKFMDVNGDGKVNTAGDFTMIGDPNPDFTYGLGANLDYRSWDLNFFFQGVYGNDIFNILKYNTYTTSNGGLNLSPELLDAYIPAVWNTRDRNVPPVEVSPASNTNTGIPRLDADMTSCDFYVEDGSYLRLKNLQLGYSLPAKWANKLTVQKFRIYVGAKNLLTFTKYTGFDPEVNETTIRERGFDRGTYPQAKMYMVGINVAF